MEVIMLSKEEYKNIMDALNEIKAKVTEGSKQQINKFIDNADLIQMMKISKRTAQAWRDDGKIPFSKVGNKLYYSLSDVEDLLKQNSFNSFKPLRAKKIVI